MLEGTAYFLEVILLHLVVFLKPLEHALVSFLVLVVQEDFFARESLEHLVELSHGLHVLFLAGRVSFVFGLLFNLFKNLSYFGLVCFFFVYYFLEFVENLVHKHLVFIHLLDLPVLAIDQLLVIFPLGVGVGYFFIHLFRFLIHFRQLFVKFFLQPLFFVVVDDLVDC